jgi:hypothetical protein
MSSRLQMHRQETEAREYLAQWKDDYGALKVERDQLAAEFRELLVDLFGRITANDAELSDLHQARPAGVALHLAGAELRARGLESFSRSDPSIVGELKLPDWERSDQTAWPKRVSFDPALIAPVVVGDPRQYTADWWQVQEQEAHALQQRQQREAAEQKAAARTNWRGPRWWEGERP